MSSRPRKVCLQVQELEGRLIPSAGMILPQPAAPTVAPGIIIRTVVETMPVLPPGSPAVIIRTVVDSAVPTPIPMASLTSRLDRMDCPCCAGLAIAFEQFEDSNGMAGDPSHLLQRNACLQVEALEQRDVPSATLESVPGLATAAVNSDFNPQVVANLGQEIRRIMPADGTVAALGNASDYAVQIGNDGQFTIRKNITVTLFEGGGTAQSGGKKLYVGNLDTAPGSVATP